MTIQRNLNLTRKENYKSLLPFCWLRPNASYIVDIFMVNENRKITVELVISMIHSDKVLDVRLCRNSDGLAEFEFLSSKNDRNVLVCRFPAFLPCQFFHN